MVGVSARVVWWNRGGLFPRPTPQAVGMALTPTLLAPTPPNSNYAIGCCQPVTHPGFYCPGGSTTSTPSAACPAWQVLIDTVRALSPATAIVPGPDGCLVNGEVYGGTYPLYHATSVEQNSYSCTQTSTPLGGPYFAVAESDFSSRNQGGFGIPRTRASTRPRSSSRSISRWSRART